MRTTQDAAPCNTFNPGSFCTNGLRHLGGYELVEEIGRGAMGVVFKAHNHRLERDVAVKLLASGVMATRDSVRRFYHEAKLAAKLDHPNIVQIIEVGDDEGQLFLVMRWIEGGTLQKRLAKGALPDQVAVRMMITIARAVHHAHERGILHRDLKPANILLDSDDQPCVADFGLARLFEEESDLTQTGALIGTPAYMAPEQALGGERCGTTAADVYSLGAIFFEMLTGHPAFDGKTPLEVLKKVTEQEPPSLQIFHSHIDADLEVICRKCLSKEPSRRYASAHELAEDLKRWLYREPINARPATAGERLVKWVRRRPATAGLSLSLSLTFLAGLTAVFAEWRKEVKSDLAARRNLYAADMSHAFRALRDNDFGRVEELLRLHAENSGPDLRDWEWDYLAGQCASTEIATIAQMPGRVFDLVFSRDGSRFAAVASDGTIALIDAKTKARIFESHDAQPMLAVAFAKNSDFVITASLEAGFKRWAVTNGTSEILSWPLSPVLQIRSSPDESVVAVSGYGVGVISLDNERQPKMISTELVSRLAWRRDGKLLAGGAHPGTLHLWDMESKREVAHWKAHRPISPPIPTVTALALSPDGHWLISAGADEKMFRWDLQAQNSSTEVTNFSGSIQALAFSPDGKFLAAGGSDQHIRVWETETWKIVSTASGHRSEVSSLAWSPDGERIFSGAVDGAVKVWLRENPKAKREHVILSTPSQTLWGSPDNSTVLVKGPHGLALWDLVSLDELPIDSGPTNIDVTIPAAKGELVSSLHDGNICRWEAETGRVIDSIQGSTNGIFWLSLTKDCSRLAALSQGANGVFVEAWDLKSREKLFVAPAERSFTPVLAWANDGQYLAAGSVNGMVHVWDARSGGELARFHAHNDMLLGGCFSPDSHLFATTGMDGIVKIWEIPTLRLHLPPFKISKTSVMAMAFSENGRRLATGAGDGTLRIWDSETGQETGVLPLHKGYIRVLGFLPDQTLVSVSSDEISSWPIKLRLGQR